MINAIIKGIFWLITSLATAILNPIVSAVSLLIPDLANAITSVINWLSMGFQFIPLALSLICVPRSAITFVFDYFIIKYTIYLLTRTIKATLRIYNNLKI